MGLRQSPSRNHLIILELSFIQQMRPLKEMPLTLVKSIRFILCDIDDTLTVEGSLPAETFTMLHRLKESGFCVIPVTGRPAGWCDHIARFWPVDGIVGENGAFYFRYDSASKKMLRHYFKDEVNRHKDRERLNAIQEQIWFFTFKLGCYQIENGITMNSVRFWVRVSFRVRSRFRFRFKIRFRFEV